MKTLIICKSVHHGSTQKIANTLAQELDAKIIEPNQFMDIDISKYDTIGFGSGIYSDTFHPSIIKLINIIPSFRGKKVFLFSTAGVIYDKSHRQMKALLKEKGAAFLGEFKCKGFNTNVFLKYFGGMNKGRPNQDDMNNAKIFAKELLK